MFHICNVCDRRYPHTSALASLYHRWGRIGKEFNKIKLVQWLGLTSTAAEDQRKWTHTRTRALHVEKWERQRGIRALKFTWLKLNWNKYFDEITRDRIKAQKRARECGIDGNSWVRTSMIDVCALLWQHILFIYLILKQQQQQHKHIHLCMNVRSNAINCPTCYIYRFMCVCCFFFQLAFYYGIQ